jgi:hypothetical protein
MHASICDDALHRSGLFQKSRDFLAEQRPTESCEGGDQCLGQPKRIRDLAHSRNEGRVSDAGGQRGLHLAGLGSAQDADGRPAAAAHFDAWCGAAKRFLTFPCIQEPSPVDQVLGSGRGDQRGISVIEPTQQGGAQPRREPRPLCPGHAERPVLSEQHLRCPAPNAWRGEGHA